MNALSTSSMTAIEIVSDANASESARLSGTPARRTETHRQPEAEHERERDREHDRGQVAETERRRDHHAEHLADRTARQAVQRRLDGGPRERRPRRAPSMGLGEALHGLEQLAALLVRGGRVARGERAGDAVLDVLFEHLQRDGLERGADGAELRQDVDAVAVVLDHARDAAHLALDAREALQELLLVRRVAGRGLRWR